MKKRVSLILLLALLAAGGLYAQDDDKPSVTVTAGVDVVSNYVWRGWDVYSSYADQKNKSYGSTTGMWAVQPDITFNTPIEGLYVEIWGSFATAGRNDRDQDKIIQRGAYGSDYLEEQGFYTKDGVDLDVLEPAFEDYGGCPDNFTDFANDNACAPGLYKEQNGLKRADELDFIMGYSFGDFEAGIVAYYLPNVVSVGPNAQTELYIAWAPEVLQGVSVGANYDIQTSLQYYSVGWGRDIDLGNDTSISIGANAGYAVEDIQGWRDVNASIGISKKGFSVSVNATYRPDLRFYDTDTNPDWIPVGLEGGSTRGDGLVEDPSKVNGYRNRIINNVVNLNLADEELTEDYTYTPRQKIPRMLYWIQFGYSTDL